jgi:hypothetical protein
MLVLSFFVAIRARACGSQAEMAVFCFLLNVMRRSCDRHDP